MKRKALMFIAAAAASAITLSAAGCGGGSYASKPYGSPVAAIGDMKPGQTKGEGWHTLGAGWETLPPVGRKIDSDG